MVRAVAEKTFLPTKSLLEEVGNMVILTGKTVVAALRPPYPYGAEFVGQFMFALKLCWFALLISTVAFGYKAQGVQAAGVVVLLGGRVRVGGWLVVVSVRDFAPFGAGVA